MLIELLTYYIGVGLGVVLGIGLGWIFARTYYKPPIRKQIIHELKE